MTIPDSFRGLTIHWHGVDSTTPAGCTMLVTEVLGIATTYILRDGDIIGRIEMAGATINGYAGPGLKGGGYLGSSTYEDLARRIADWKDPA
jgi:hypothetical protein